MSVLHVRRAENIVHVVLGHGPQEVAYLLLSLEGTHPSRYYRIICNRFQWHISLFDLITTGAKLSNTFHL